MQGDRTCRTRRPRSRRPVPHLATSGPRRDPRLIETPRRRREDDSASRAPRWNRGCPGPRLIVRRLGELRTSRTVATRVRCSADFVAANRGSHDRPWRTVSSPQPRPRRSRAKTLASTDNRCIEVRAASTTSPAAAPHNQLSPFRSHAEQRRSDTEWLELQQRLAAKTKPDRLQPHQIRRGDIAQVHVRSQALDEVILEL